MMKKTDTKRQGTGLALLILIFGMNFVWAQKSISINDKLQNFSQSNIGDTVLLDFFSNKRYKAIVKQVSKSYDGITGITTQILDSQWGYCYISVLGNDVAISAELPQSNEYFSTGKLNGKNYLFEQKLSSIRKNEKAEIALFDPEDNKANKKSRLHRSSTGNSDSYALPPSNDTVVIDLLVAYTPAAKQWAIANAGSIDLLIDQALQKANLAFSNSQTNITLNMVHKCELNYTESGSSNTDLIRLTKTNDGIMDDIHVLRRHYNADMVTMLAALTSVGGAGWVLGSEWGSPQNAFSIVRIAQAVTSLSMVHEIAHNMGCGHHREIENHGLYSYSRGWRGITGQGNKYSTVMTYETGNYSHEPNIAYTRIPYFSSPNTTFEGIVIGDANTDNAMTLRQTKSVVAAYSEELKYMDAFLQDIQLSNGTLTPAFRPEITQYSVTVDTSVSSISVTGIPNYNAATVSGNVTNQSLQMGDNTISLVVTNAYGDQNTQKTYGVTITRSLSDTASNINEFDGIWSKFTLYPNPAIAGTIVHLEAKLDAALLQGSTIEVYNSMGSLIYQTEATERTTILPVPNRKGIYPCVLKTRNGNRYNLKMAVVL
ncbi:MAG: cadherin-like beta sandwich domain-containing protein [Bacteroidales bacterium]|nr:cadherin-like beta sandwich domain-containing protein [Bacteroidales bacterium]